MDKIHLKSSAVNPTKDLPPLPTADLDALGITVVPRIQGKGNVISEPIYRRKLSASIAHKREFNDLIVASATTAANLMINALNDDELPMALRIDVAKDLMNRACGKAVDSVQLAVANVDGENKPMERMSEAELLAIIRRGDE
jgi:hypothetical protein